MNFQMTQGGYQVRKKFTDKKQNGCCKEAVLFTISVFYWIFTSVIQSPRFTNDYEFGISVSTYQ